ncbi:MAG TPA: phosphodiester glycosidase family protein [Chitinophagaceae bacterium]|nr:phosphodiester glycosidase family protein [Chitinophagaceae bacterium]HQX73541.1 phosphodiester glycosidase family protein [Chitinophagaceae bacterium]
MKKIFFTGAIVLLVAPFCFGQLKWQNVDSLFQPLPPSVHVYKTTDQLDGKPNIAYYVEADLKDKKLDFTVDTTYKRRLKPSQFYEKNNQPLLVVNTTFFSFATNQNLNVVIKKGKMIGYNIHTISGKGKDTLTYRHPFGSAIGISKKREAYVAWVYTDSSLRFAYATESVFQPVRDSIAIFPFQGFLKQFPQLDGVTRQGLKNHTRWKMKTAVGGGPVLLQNGDIKITNNEELKFAGKAINDKHPRTAMGYTGDNKLVILVIEGRNPGKAEGATLIQQAQIFKDLGCREALNLDGGGSSCMLVNGKETIKVSDASGQRPVPAVFIIRNK